MIAGTGDGVGEGVGVADGDGDGEGEGDGVGETVWTGSPAPPQPMASRESVDMNTRISSIVSLFTASPSSGDPYFIPVNTRR